MRSIEQIIESQLERWAVERRAETESGKKARAKTSATHSVRPWIAVSRDYGANGTAVAGRLAGQLGYELFDRRLLDALSHETHYRKEFLESVDEKVRSTVEAHLDALLHGESFLRSDFLRHLMRVVAVIGEHGHAVIVGRGAVRILAPEGGLSVRIVAPFEQRVNEIASRLSIPQADARLRVLEVDRSRADFLRTHFHGNSWKPEDHDLMLNTARMTIDQAAELVESALFARFPQERESLRRAG